ncbi:hypothetical protein GJU41_11835 [Bacillus idriensis]|uniref:YqaJ viral recombinase domain-containing protein n=1 Tax=Metabacillus idriensis TaxID=324768 RepID=A0A6I2MFS9_9BACI|nr:hypothetical protein [Metabacillus idriensis]MRX54663.1 hypothetical protein [Metabacillus idriensis]
MTEIKRQNAAAALRGQIESSEASGNKAMADKIAQEFNDMLHEFHTYEQPYDDMMDAEFYEQYARVLREQSKWGYFNWKTAPDGTPRPAFSPSNAGKTERELYEKARKAKRDKKTPTSNQRDWTGLGSQVGGYIQREMMLIERHYEKLTGKKPKFRFERTKRNEPSFEHFVKKMHEVEYAGEKFAFNGLPDGILIYTDDDGKEYRVGLEVKSFQKSYVEFKKVEQPKTDHALQTVMYSEMYGLDYFIVLYHLTYGVEWKKDINRNKTFGKYVTQAEREELFAKFARVTKAVRLSDPPELDLIDGWAFNDFKTSIAKTITDDELSKLKTNFDRIKKSRLPEWKKNNYFQALEFIESVRKSEAV